MKIFSGPVDVSSFLLQDGCTALHAAVRSGQVDTLRVLLCHPTQGDPTVTPDPPATLALPAALLNQANSDGWTAAHMAAALGLKVRMGLCSNVQLFHFILLHLMHTAYVT